METLVKKPLHVQVALRLKQGLEAGEWQGKMPGLRPLADFLQVSIPTLRLAQEVLRGEGFLQNTGGRKRARIAGPACPQTQPVEGEPSARTILILTDGPWWELPTFDVALIVKVMISLSRKKWTVHPVILPFSEARHPRKAWDEVLARHKPSALVAMYGRQVLSRWAARHKLPLISLGGCIPEDEGVTIAVSATDMLLMGMRRLTELGHQRVFFPMLQRSENFTNHLQEVMGKYARAAGHDFHSSLQMPASTYSEPAILWQMLETAFRQWRPTAILVMDWNEYTLCCSFLHQHGLQIPRDVSLILLGDRMGRPWYSPVPTCFEFRLERALKMIHKEFNKPGMPVPGWRQLPMGWMADGQSLGPAPGKGSAGRVDEVKQGFPLSRRADAFFKL